MNREQQLGTTQQSRDNNQSLEEIYILLSTLERQILSGLPSSQPEIETAEVVRLEEKASPLDNHSSL